MVFNLPIPRLPSRPPSHSRSSSRFPSSSSTLAEALRTNPFGTRSQQDISKPEPEEALGALNDDLLALALFFPDVKTEVLRELIVRFPGDSRLHVCTEQLLKYKAEWVKGRWNVPPAELKDGLPIEEQFRSQEYKEKTKGTLCAEFRALSKSTVDAVLAENNYCYTRARPVLQELARKTWRATFENLGLFKKKRTKSEPPAHLFEQSPTTGNLRIRSTGSQELDKELRALYLRPSATQQKESQEENDRRLALQLGQAEAEKADALYECDCCCGETTFETMAMCTQSCHISCVDCIKRTMHEALFGQGWGKSIDADRGTLKCLAPVVDETCEGCIPQQAVRQALLTEKAGSEGLAKFDERLTAEALLKAQVQLVRCPFCSYAEADPACSPDPAQRLAWRFKPANSFGTFLAYIILLDILPFILFIIIVLALVSPTPPSTVFTRSLQDLSRRARSPRFICRHPACGRASCLKCSKPWHDPHTCHEPLLISLRTTVEAARTAAVKRTCPRCGLGFVKLSGCNKLTCICGYTMCYLCRKQLNSGVGGEADEGYRHFCEHFRVQPGRPCAECRKCELYREEDEEGAVRRAGDEAEREWRVKEGMVGVEGLGVGGVDGRDGESWWDRWLDGRWEVQEVVDWGLGTVVEVEV